MQVSLYPQINGTAEAFRLEPSIALSSLIVGKRTTNEFTSIINASYDLDIWGEIRSASESALALLMGEVDTRRTVVLTLVTSVASTYVQLLQYDAQKEIGLETLRSRTESFELAKTRFEGGLTSELEVKQAKYEMQGAAAQVILVEIAIAEQENLLSVLIGHPPQYIVRGLKLEQLVLPVTFRQEYLLK